MTPADIDVDLARNIAHVAGRDISLPAKEAELLHVLARGGVARYGHLISQLWCLDEPETALATIKTLVCYLRRKLAGTGVRIDNHWGVGFELVRDRPPPGAGLLSAL